MPQKQAPSQFWKLYEKLPQELKDALFAESTGENIYNACLKNDAGDVLEKAVDIAGRVLVGMLDPQFFASALEKEADLDKETAESISKEITRLVFYPVKEELSLVYSPITQAVPKAPNVKTSVPKAPEPAATDLSREKMPGRKDSYREPIQ